MLRYLYRWGSSCMLYLWVFIAVLLVSNVAQAMTSEEFADQLIDGMARGDWVLIFGALVSVLNRLLDAGLKERIPKKWLPYTAVVIGFLTQTSAALAVASLVLGVGVGTLLQMDTKVGDSTSPSGGLLTALLFLGVVVLPASSLVPS